MSTVSSRIADDFAAAEQYLPASVLSTERRRSALQALQAQGLPTSREENWKYVNLRPLEKVRFAPLAARTGKAITVADLPPQLLGYARYTFVDGVFAPELSSAVDRPGVLIEPMRRTSQPRPAVGGLEARQSGDLRFALLNDAFATDGASIRIAAEIDCPACVELVFVAATDSREAASYPRVDLAVASGARVGLIERHVSIGNDANFVNCAVSISAARASFVQHYRIQQTGARAQWYDTLSADLAESARYQLFSVHLGALTARSTVNIQLNGERAEVDLYAVSVGDARQVHDTYARIEHIAPRTRTSQSFRGISSGRARVAFNGKVTVSAGAYGTDSRQSLRGLLAGTEAEIDVRPQLEIYTDDVRCSHGATAGKLDDDMLFYLLSRGLERETAQRLLKWAFLEDVVAKIEVPELRRQIEQSLAGQLKEAAALQELL
ncbi:MAG TPA: Fe-S cluster assembly protein SufD [Steroidobacteraceae bacterium]|nr:Fe-S cluster assembly protein SufD [Steroidobacteraceae bacterium]